MILVVNSEVGLISLCDVLVLVGSVGLFVEIIVMFGYVGWDVG